MNSGEARSVPVLSTGFTKRVAVPGSKSIANRALICALLADGESRVSNLPDGDDTASMLAALPGLGAEISVVGDEARVTGVAGRPMHGEFDAGLAGTTSRFLCAVSALGDGESVVTGAAPLKGRPFGGLLDALRELGARVDADGDGLPARITGPLRGGEVELAADVSSQFVSALLLAGPCMAEGLSLRLTGPAVSRPYIDMTIAVMERFGAKISETAGTVVVEPTGYRSAVVEVEPDASSASYPAAIAALRAGQVLIDGLGERSLQGDTAFRELLRSMGVAVEVTGDTTRVTGSEGALEPLVADLGQCSDLVPTFAVLAAFANGTSRLTGIGFIRRKESDRIGDLAACLTRCGVRVIVEDDGLVIEGGKPHGARMPTHHDHRLAMAFGVLGCAVPDVLIEDPDVVTKSWPGFWTMLETLRN